MKNLIQKKFRNDLRRILPVLVGVGFLAGLAAPAFAAPTEASLRLGDSRPEATDVAHTFATSGINTGNTVRCVEVDLGSNSDGTGAITDIGGTPTLDSGTLFGTFGNWSVRTTDWASDRKLQATYTTGEVLNATGNVVWSGVTNGSTVDTGYYAVFTLYSDDACSTAISGETTTVQFIYTTGQEVSLTVDPSFTFTVADVASGQSINAATTTETTVATTATTIPFSNSVTTSTNGVAAQDLTINTNAQDGYSIYAHYTGALASGGNTIDNHSGTNATPTTFSAAGTEAFGYTTDNLSRFTSGSDDLWAAFVTSNSANAEVATSATALTAAETTRIGFQVGLAADTAAGTYATTVIYTAVPTY